MTSPSGPAARPLTRERKESRGHGRSSTPSYRNRPPPVAIQRKPRVSCLTELTSEKGSPRSSRTSPSRAPERRPRERGGWSPGTGSRPSIGGGGQRGPRARRPLGGSRQRDDPRGLTFAPLLPQRLRGQYLHAIAESGDNLVGRKPSYPGTGDYQKAPARIPLRPSGSTPTKPLRPEPYRFFPHPIRGFPPIPTHPTITYGSSGTPPTARALSSSGCPGSQPSPRRGAMPLRILIAEDQLMVRQGLNALLEQAG